MSVQTGSSSDRARIRRNYLYVVILRYLWHSVTFRWLSVGGYWSLELLYEGITIRYIKYQVIIPSQMASSLEWIWESLYREFGERCDRYNDRKRLVKSINCLYCPLRGIIILYGIIYYGLCACYASPITHPRCWFGSVGLGYEGTLNKL